MKTAIRLGVALRAQHGIRWIATEDDVDRVIADSDPPIEVVEGWGFRSHRLKAQRVERAIYLRDGLTAGERIVYKAHELGHVLQHAGNQLFLALPQTVHLKNRQELAAQMFAGGLLLGYPCQPGFDERLHDAFEQGYPLEFLFSFFAAYSNAPPIERIGE